MVRSAQRIENGHAFDFSRDVCVLCGMTSEAFNDAGKPFCKGRDSDKAKPREPIIVPEE